MMKKIKVIFNDGTVLYFDGESFEHNAEHKMFFIKLGTKIMIPDSAVAVIGVFDIENGKFV